MCFAPHIRAGGRAGSGDPRVLDVFESPRARARRGHTGGVVEGADGAVDDLGQIGVAQDEEDGEVGVAAHVARDDELALLPDGYRVERRRARSGRAYKVYLSPDGRVFRSRQDVFRALAAADDSSSDGDRVDAMSSPSVSPSLDMLRSTAEDVTLAAQAAAHGISSPDPRSVGRSSRSARRRSVQSWSRDSATIPVSWTTFRHP